jgi:hypothetical protein
MEQMLQAAVGVESSVVDLLATNNDDVTDYDEKLMNDDGVEKEDQELVSNVRNEDEVANG